MAFFFLGDHGIVCYIYKSPRINPEAFEREKIRQ